MSDINDQWKRFLTPDILRENLLSASIYIVAFEILKNTIIDRVKEAYTEFYEDKTQPGVKYKKEVLSKVTKKKSLAIVSLEWLITEQVINHQDLSEYNKIKNIRNSLVHEFPHIWEKGLPGKFLKLFQDIIDLLLKIEKWWIVDYEIPANPDFESKEIEVDKVIPGVILGLRMLIYVALGSEQEAKQYLNILNNNSDSV